MPSAKVYYDLFGDPRQPRTDASPIGGSVAPGGAPIVDEEYYWNNSWGNPKQK